MSRGQRRFSDPPEVAEFRERPTIVPPPPTSPDRSRAWFEVQLGWARLSNDECARVAELVMSMAEGRG